MQSVGSFPIGRDSSTSLAQPRASPTFWIRQPFFTESHPCASKASLLKLPKNNNADNASSMATALQPRPRAARVAAPGGRPLQVPRDFNSAASGHAVHGAVAVAASASASTTPSVPLFLTNLRLLDLDLAADWPGISLDTFAAAGAAGAQGQKKRIQCVEWALFHLFDLWDSDETASKLKPFFPPLDHVQSLNLRAALLRCLEQAKKNGALGRDAILRKTMLDECKGERLEDLLAVFSSAVLKKVAANESRLGAGGRHPAASLSIALENRGYAGDKTELACLILAHRVSLRRLRQNREVNAAKFRDFADLLGIKEKSLVRRQEEARSRAEKGAAARTVSDEARHEMWRTVRNNWSGNERWMETLFYGDVSIKKDGLIGMPFDRVWRRVQQSRLAEVESKDTGLLEQLESRVNVHRERLEKWQRYRNVMFPQGQAAASPTKRREPAKPKKGIDFGFNQHENLVLGRMEKQQSKLGSRMTAEYRDLLNGLNKELASVDQAQPKALLFLQQRKKHSHRLSGASEVISEISSLGDDSLDMSPVEDEEETTQTLPIQTKPSARRLLRPNLARPDLGAFSYSNGASKSEAESVTSTANPEDAQPSHLSTPCTPTAKSTHQFPSQDYNTNEPEISAESPTQELADQILESMDNASPSPKKKRPKARHTLSLAERTRLSMAPRGASLFLDDEEDEEDDDPTITVPTPRNDTAEIDLDVEVENDLVSRTRKSMAGFEKARQKAQLERRRSQRKSRAPLQSRESSFPKLDEEDDDQGVLAQELMGEQDMEAVFRSRPRIQASPLPSPTRELDAWGDD